MIKPKLIMRSGFAISGIGHMAILTVGLIFAGANPFDVAPTTAITVDIVSPDEVETGSAKPAATAAETAETAPSFEPAAAQPQPAPQSAPQATPPPSPPTTRQASAATQVAPSSPSFIPWPQPPAEPPPPAEPHESNPADMFGMPLALPGGMVGYEYLGLATEKPDIADDAIAAFRKRLKTCSILPAGVAAEARVTLRIDLNPDGTLVKGPENPHAVGLIYGASVGAGDLYTAAMAAVRKCQPYKMLPPDRYEEWKMLDFTFTRKNF
jgi:hypothetical protein